MLEFFFQITGIVSIASENVGTTSSLLYGIHQIATDILDIIGE